MDAMTPLPLPSLMYEAMAHRDGAFDGVFVAAVRTTGVFCRPTCPARTPNRENVAFFPAARDAVLSGYRPCKRCRPLHLQGQSPTWLAPLLDEVEQRSAHRWRDRDLRSLDLEPERVRRWFHTHHGLTFHGYARARGAGRALAPAGAGFDDLFGADPGPGATVEAAATLLQTPLGALVAAATDEAVCLLEFADRPMLRTQVERVRRRQGVTLTPGTNRWTELLTRELEAYFGGSLRSFTVPVAAAGSPFQESVWRELRAIPYGETRSYAELASAVGRPAAVRAVGTANGDNRLSILLPCHRVVGSDGELRGYGGGLWRKRRLLELEGADVS